MLPLTSLYIDRLVARQLLNTAKGTNHDIYDRRLTAAVPWPPYAVVPRCIYFYYMVVDNDNKLKVDHYFYNMGPDLNNPVQWDHIPYDRVPAIIDALASQGRTGAATPGTLLPDNNFRKIVWDHRSYVAVVVDESNWNLHRRSSGNSALVFNVDKPGEPNRSFFDALDIDVHVTDSKGNVDTRSGVYFVNHMMMDSQGTTLNTAELMYFDMYFAVNFNDRAATPITVIVDPTGTNQGPPTPPDP